MVHSHDLSVVHIAMGKHCGKLYQTVWAYLDTFSLGKQGWDKPQEVKNLFGQNLGIMWEIQFSLF